MNEKTEEEKRREALEKAISVAQSTKAYNVEEVMQLADRFYTYLFSTVAQTTSATP